jgi:hypothetical protein
MSDTFRVAGELVRRSHFESGEQAHRLHRKARCSSPVAVSRWYDIAVIRRLSTIASGVSLLLFIASASVWVISARRLASNCCS